LIWKRQIVSSSVARWTKNVGVEKYWHGWIADNAAILRPLTGNIAASFFYDSIAAKILDPLVLPVIFQQYLH